MTRTLLTTALLGLLLAAPLAFAQEEQPPTNESRDAWVKDCPPDMMCAYGGGSGEGVDCTDAANETREECQTCPECPKSHAPADGPTYDGNCGGEVCAYGNESCIECSGPVDDGSDNCMDGQQEGEACRGADCENCRTLTGNEGGEKAPADGEVQSDASTNEVPGFAAALVFVGMAAAVLVVARRR